MTLLRIIRHLRRSDQAQALIEFALFASLFVVMLMGMSDVAFYLLGTMMMQEVAASGANYGAAPGNQIDTSGMVTWANQASYFIRLTGTPTASTFWVCSPGGTHVASSTTCSGSAPLEYVQVTAVATIPPILQTSLFGNVNITATSICRVAWKTQ